MKVLGLFVLCLITVAFAPTAAYAQESESDLAVGPDDDSSYTFTHSSETRWGPWKVIWQGGCAATSVAGRIAWAVGGALSFSGQVILTGCTVAVVTQQIIQAQQYLQGLSQNYYGDPFTIDFSVTPL